jgi:hypothetical protein
MVCRRETGRSGRSPNPRPDLEVLIQNPMEGSGRRARRRATESLHRAESASKSRSGRPSRRCRPDALLRRSPAIPGSPPPAGVGRLATNEHDPRLRGRFMVAKAVDSPERFRVEWAPVDVLAADGTRIEVKTSSYLQSRAQERPSRPASTPGRPAPTCTAGSRRTPDARQTAGNANQPGEPDQRERDRAPGAHHDEMRTPYAGRGAGESASLSTPRQAAVRLPQW